MYSTPIQLKSPNKSTKICFDVVTLEERQRLLREEALSVFKIHKNPFYEMPIHLLRNGDYLYGITGDSYALLFHNIQDLDLLLDKTSGYYEVGIHFVNGICYYGYYLQNDKIIELWNDPNKIQIGGYSRKPEWKVYQLEDGAILYIEQRTEAVFSGRWYPNLKTFEYFYDNRYAP